MATPPRKSIKLQPPRITPFLAITPWLPWGVIFLFVCFCLYNGSMNNYNTPNSGCCGRPMHYATGPKCGQNHCCFNEYNYKTNACIRKKQPDCDAQAVIPAITVETTFGLSSYTNCFVHVTGNNTTYYVDDKGTPIIAWKGNVEANLPDNVQTQEEWEEFLKSFKLRGQFLYLKFRGQDFGQDLIDSFYFSNSGKIYFAGEFEDTGIGG